MKKMKTKTKKIFSLSVLVLCIAVFGLVSAASADYTEPDIETIMNTNYQDSWTEILGTEFTFTSGEYAATVILVTKEAGMRDDIGLYEGDTSARDELFDNPQKDNPPLPVTIASNKDFGFYIDAGWDGEITYYTETSENPEEDGAQRQHARIFAIDTDDDGDKDDGYAIAFEDLPPSQWSGPHEPDYNDIVIELRGQGVTLIPEFATIAIPAASILGLLFFFNHRKHRKERSEKEKVKK